MSSRFFLSVLLGTVVNFLLGWIIYGMLLMGYMETLMTEYDGLMNEENGAIIISYVVSSLMMAILITYTLQKGARSNARQGLVTGAIIGFCIAVSYNVMFYTGWNLATGEYYLIDTLAFTVMTSLTGLVVGWMQGRNANTAAQSAEV